MSTSEDLYGKLKPFIYSRNHKSLRQLLDENPTVDLNSTSDGLPLIHLAVKSSDKIVKLLIERGADINIKENDDENTPLHVAVRDKRKRIVDVLLENKADVNLRNKQGETSLHIALRKNLPKIGKELLRRNADGGFPYNVASNKSLTQQIAEHEDPSWKKIIYLNSSNPSSGKFKDFDPTCGGLGGLEGNMYQVLMLILICIRARKIYDGFQIMTEVKAAGKLDDIVIRYLEDGEWHARFIQLKHKNSNNEDKNKLTVRELKQKKGSFELIQYIDSIVDILNFEIFKDDILEDFIICTTADLEEGKVSVFKDSDKFNTDKLLFFKAKSSRVSKAFLEEIISKDTTKKEDIIIFATASLGFEDKLLFFKYNDIQDKLSQFSKKHIEESISKEKINKEEIFICTTANLDRSHKSETDKLLFYKYDEFQCKLSQTNKRYLEEKIDKKINLGEICEKLYFITSYPNVSLLKKLILKELNQHQDAEIINNALLEKALNHVLEAKGKPLNKSDVDDLIEEFEGHLCFQQCKGLSKQNMSKYVCKGIHFIKGSLDVENLSHSSVLQEPITIKTERVGLALIYITNCLKKNGFLLLTDENLATEAIVFKALEDRRGTIYIFVECQSFLKKIVAGKFEVKIISIEQSSGPCEFDKRLHFENLSQKTKDKIIGKHNWFEEIETIHNYVERNLTIENSTKDQSKPKVVETFSEQDFLNAREDSKDRLIVVVGDPGMGKSSLMKHLKMKLQKKGHWVILLSLNDFTFDKRKAFHLSNANFLKAEMHSAVQFLIGMLSSTCRLKNKVNGPLLFDLLELSLLSNSSSNLPRPFILLDAFDEISPSYDEKVLCLIEALQPTNAAQIWLTTRPHESEKISERFQLTNYTLIPFNTQDKIKHLLGHCRSLIRTTMDQKKLITMQENFLTIFHSLLNGEEPFDPKYQEDKRRLIELLELEEEPRLSNNVGQSFINMLENPLQFHMLLSLCEKPDLLVDMNVSEVYEEFIAEMFRVFFQKESNSDGTNQIQISLRKLCEAQYEKLACNALFVENELYRPLELDDSSNIARVGLLTKEGDKFVHKSYAEYYAAEQLLKNNFFQRSDFMIEVLLKETYRQVCVFINESLRAKRRNINFKTLKQSFDTVNASNENILHKAAERGHCEIIKYLKDMINDKSVFQKLVMQITSNGETVLDKASISVEYESCFHVFYDLLDRKTYSGLLGRSKMYKLRIFSHAIPTGKYSKIYKFFRRYCHNESIDQVIRAGDIEKNTIAHLAIQGNTFEEFLDASIHLPSKTIQSLLQSTNENGDTMLHFAVYSKHFISYCNLISNNLSRKQFNDLLLKSNKNGFTTMHSAASHGKTKDLVLFLQDKFTDLNLVKNLISHTRKGYTLLHLAARTEDFAATANMLADILDEKEFEDLLLKKDNQGLTCIFSSTKSGKIADVISFVRDKLGNLDIGKRLLSSVDDHKILRIAESSGHFDATAESIFDTIGKEKFEKLCFKKDPLEWIKNNSWSQFRRFNKKFMFLGIIMYGFQFFKLSLPKPRVYFYLFPILLALIVFILFPECFIYFLICISTGYLVSFVKNRGWF